MNTSSEDKNNRQYKDSVFVDLFSEDQSAHENFISLYNALHNSNFSINDIHLEKIKLEKILYMNFFNDVSFVVNDKIIILVEHQSTVNQNMPLRLLMYISRLYEQITGQEDKYARRLVKIPIPEFYVLYNGDDECPLEQTLKLSNAFKFDKNDEKYINLELLVKVININLKKKSGLLDKSKTLKEYSQFIDIAKECIKLDGENGFANAIQLCIDKDILSEYLKRKGKEVLSMLVTEYDYDLDIKVQRNEARKEGIEKGKLEGIEKGKLEGIEKGKLEGIEKGKLETAKQLKKLGLNLDLIKEATGLSLEYLQNL